LAFDDEGKGEEQQADQDQERKRVGFLLWRHDSRGIVLPSKTVSKGGQAGISLKIRGGIAMIACRYLGHRSRTLFMTPSLPWVKTRRDASQSF